MSTTQALRGITTDPDSGQISETQGKPEIEIAIADKSDFATKLMKEPCSACCPHPSYFDGSDEIPAEWHHMPWDEVEMRKHKLLNSRCEHLDEMRVRTDPEWRRHLIKTQTTQDHPRKLKFVLDEESASEVAATEDSHEREQIEKAPVRCSVIDTEQIDRNLTVKRLTGGGRLIEVKSNTGCELRLLEIKGDHLVVATRCDGREGVSAAASLSSSDGTMRSQAPPLALTSKLSHEGKAEVPSVSAPPTMSCLNREPAAFESVVAESEGYPSTGNGGSAIPDAIKSDREPKPAGKSRKRSNVRRRRDLKTQMPSAGAELTRRSGKQSRSRSRSSKVSVKVRITNRL